MATWRVARSLDVLLGQLNAMAPKRSKVSDGGIGDAAHATRDSDHNPWVKQGAMGIVTARDYSNDPAHGLDCNQLAEWLTTSGDGRIKYVIWNRRIWSPTKGWQKYTGTNPHDKHLHLSVESAAALYDDATPWRLATPAAAKPTPAPVKEEGFLMALSDAEQKELLGHVRQIVKELNGPDYLLPPGQAKTGWPVKADGTRRTVVSMLADLWNRPA